MNIKHLINIESELFLTVPESGSAQVTPINKNTAIISEMNRENVVVQVIKRNNKFIIAGFDTIDEKEVMKVFEDSRFEVKKDRHVFELDKVKKLLYDEQADVLISLYELMESQVELEEADAIKVIKVLKENGGYSPIYVCTVLQSANPLDIESLTESPDNYTLILRFKQISNSDINVEDENYS